MVYLLDTHTLLWWFSDPNTLSDKARSIIENPKNVIFISSVVTWEIVIKKSLDKLKIPNKFFELIKEGQFQELPIMIEHTQALASLPPHHNDPFDRLLVAQAKSENGTILTRDRTIMKYDVKTIKA